MTKKIIMIRELLLISAASLTHSLSSYAGEFNYNAELTLLTDSAVTIEAANIGTSNDANSDSASGQLLGTEYQFDNRLLVSYEFYNESYQDLSENDTQYHSFNASYDNNIGGFDFFLNTSHLDMSLDGEDFLTMDLVIPSLSYYFESGIYLNLSHTWIDKTFDTFTDFDAKNNATGITAYYFFANSKAYLSLNLTKGDEDANSDDNDYEEDTTTLAFQYPVSIGDYASKLNISYSVRKRDYLKVTDILNVKSREERDRFKIYLNSEINDNWSVRATYDFMDRNSNLAMSTYNSNYFALRVSYKN
jgi:hypothetical protein